jgi:maltodextrin utilization protein YvdJ
LPVSVYSLAAYTAEQRTKEIGVRKVLSERFGIGWFTSDFLKLVLAALVTASPIAWYFAEQLASGKPPSH